jgi:hypothetical protein
MLGEGADVDNAVDDSGRRLDDSTSVESPDLFRIS